MIDHGAFLELVRYNADGLVPCVIQAADGGEVLMVAYANEESLRAMLETGETHFWSRSRHELWHKGATSGNTQQVVAARLDCDHDTILVTVECAGPACHTGAVSCFHDAANGGAVTLPGSGGG